MSERELGDLMQLQAERLTRLEQLIKVLVERETVREWYSTEQFGRITGKAEFTIRENCRLGRLRAEKKISGRGAYAQWVISHQELLRYQREGLLPLRSPT